MRIDRGEDGTVDEIHLDDIETCNAIFGYLNGLGVEESLGNWKLGVRLKQGRKGIETVFIKKQKDATPESN